MLNETFTTHITFSSGDTHKEDPIKGDRVASTITRLCDGPAAQMGMIRRAIIVDELDRVCFEIKGRNVVFPLELAMRQRAYRKAQKASQK